MELSKATISRPELASGVRAQNLMLTYVTPRSTTYAVRDVSMEVGARDFAGIVGPSGSGKSSLLYLMSGLKTATSGEVFFDDFHYSAASATQKLDFRRRAFGFIFQQPFLVPYLSVLENVLVPIENPLEKDKKRAIELLDSLGIVELAPKFPNECSGGERVRASMARGLVHRPAWLWVDEPTASLDHTTGKMVMDVLKGQKQHGALVVVTHDLEILADADAVFRMRDGVLLEKFAPRDGNRDEMGVANNGQGSLQNELQYKSQNGTASGLL
ncbi:putative ABC transport system ATP-binding protein [Abditibacterium utsteinense]|uniref:Putative ABC transport system ATP-binding protein n=1 Tax=Abditibacterium utsteinense TaxID=1960156 RepID=A0A2S8SR36_9BACT|nr:ABC transporter ATP-binding protein [Abditibacterium utsteinense]PQV63245.1 putative ABC transport system ATP-binding protein [Abditibacterium utsteinense]